MIISQTINHISGDDYDVDISVTDVPDESFLSLEETTFSDDGFMRELNILILPLEGVPGGTKNINSGIFTRRENESVIQVIIKQDRYVVGRNNQTY